MKAEQEIIDEVCKPYGGFVNVITKCGGTLVSQLWIKSIRQYAQLSEVRELPTVEEFKNWFGLMNVNSPKLPTEIYGFFTSTQKPEEGKEPNNGEQYSSRNW